MINMKKKEKENRKILLYAILTVASFIAVSFGTAYAFYTATIIGNRENGDVTIKTAQPKALFIANKNLEVIDVVPGFDDTMEFSIVSVNDSPNIYGNYTIIWEIKKNELNDKDFIYSLTGETYLNGEKVDNNISNNKVVNIGNTIVPTISDVLGTGIINTGVTHKYVLRLNFRENGKNQNELSGKRFESTITIKGEPIVSKEIEE